MRAHSFASHVVCLFILSTAPSLAFAADQAPLNYSAALQLARQNSSTLKRASLEAEQGSLKLALTKYEDDARLTTQAQLGRRYHKNPAAPNSGKFTDDQTYGLTMSVPLYDFGRQSAREQQFELEADAAKIAVAEAEAQLRVQVARAYVTAVTAHRTSDLLLQQVKISAARLAEQDRNYRQGLRPESDVVTVRVDLGRAEIAAQRAADEALAGDLRLAATLGMVERPALPWNFPVDAIALSSPEALQKIITNWNDARLPASRERRALQLRAIDAEFNSINARKRPTLAAALTAQETGALTPLYPQLNAQLQLNWEIPWNGQRRAEAEVAATRRRDLQFQDDADALIRVGKAESASHSLASTQRQWSLLQKQLVLVERQLQLVEGRYRVGKASAIEVSTSEAAVITVRLDLLKLSTDAITSVLDLAEMKEISDLSAVIK